MSAYSLLSNMVANPFSRLATAKVASLQTSLAAFPVWSPDLNDSKPRLANDFKKYVQKPLLQAIFANGGNEEYLSVPLVRGRFDFCNDPANIVTEAQVRVLVKNVDTTTQALKIATTVIQKANASAALSAAKQAFDDENPRYILFKEHENFLSNYLEVATSCVSFLRRVMPPNIMLQAEGDLNPTTMLGNFTDTIDGVPIMVIGLGGILPQSKPWEDYLKFALILKKINQLMTVTNSLEVNKYRTECDDTSLYKFKPTMMFGDWKLKLHMDVMDPLHDTPKAFSKHDEIARLLTMVINCDRMHAKAVELSIDRLPLITEQTTPLEMDNIYLMFQRLDDLYWAQMGGIGSATVIEVNAAGWLAKATIDDKLQAYGGTNKSNDTKRGKMTCWKCGEDGHPYYRCKKTKEEIDSLVKAGKVKPFKPPKKPNTTTQPNKRKHTTAAAADQEDDTGEAEEAENEIEEEVIPASSAMKARTEKKPKVPASRSLRFKVNVTGIIDDRQVPILTSDHNDNEDDYSLKENDLIIDSGAMMHMMHSLHPAMTSVAVAHRSALFGNDQRLRIEKEANLGDLRQVQICSGMSKQLVSVGQLATTNGMITIFTETGCYLMRPEFRLEVPEGDVALFAPLINGLYRVELNDLADGLGN
jgi:hypothetical protein